jgi:hypothetical protein
LHLADFDTVDLTNLQRQIIHDTDSVGMSKVDSAIQRLAPSIPRFNWSPTARRWTKIPWRLRWRRWTWCSTVPTISPPAKRSTPLAWPPQAAGQRRGDSP